MSLEALDELMADAKKSGQPSRNQPVPQTGSFSSFDEWRWRAVNEHFDKTAVGKRRKGLPWREQEASFLESRKNNL